MEIFDNIFRNSEEVPFDCLWRTPIGDYSPLVSNPKYALAAGETIASRDPGNRRLLVKGTNAGNVVIHEKNRPGDGPRVIIGKFPFMFMVKVNKKPGFPLSMAGPLNEIAVNYIVNLW